VKIKSDFVTNSSSSCYMVLFSEKKPVITFKNVIEAAHMNISFSERNDKNLNKLYNAYKICIDELINEMFENQTTIYQEGIEEVLFKKYPELEKDVEEFDFFLFTTLQEILFEKGLVVDSQSLNGEGNTFILVLDRERIVSVLQNEIKT